MRVERAASAGEHGFALRVPRDAVAGDDAVCEIFFDLFAAERRGKEDACGLALAVELGDGEEFFFGERIAAPAARRRRRWRDGIVRSRRGFARCDRDRRGRARCRLSAGSMLSSFLTRIWRSIWRAASRARCKPPRSSDRPGGRSRAAFRSLIKLDAQPQIGIARLRCGADDVALHQQRGDGASEPALAARFRGERHMREARMQRQRRDGFAFFGDAAGIVERAELYQ